MEQSPKKIRIEPQFQNKSPADPQPAGLIMCKPYELIKINKSDLVDKFSRRIGHLNNSLTHKSMCRAYNQALTDAEHLLMVAEKDSKTP